MAVLGRIGLAIALIAGVSAQAGNESETVWAAVAFINNGETTPLTGDFNTVLTPEGAQQMARQGTAFRARYLRNGVNSSQFEDIEKAYIQNININVIDNSDLDISSQTFEWVNAGAMAFMQGLYPPESDSWDSSSGGSDIAHDYAQGDNITNYPLDGYQYPNVQTLGILDPQSVAIQGSLRCSAWQSDVRNNLTYDPELQNLFEDTYDFYQELFSNEPLIGAVGLDYANLWNAYLIYDFVNYMYMHNETVFENLNDATSTIAKLRAYSFILEHAKNSNQNGNGTSDPTNILYTIAGRTLANRVAQAFLSNVQWNGERDMLTLMFGSYEPIMSFLSISGLLNTKSMTSGPFSTLPEPGAAMIFELYGDNLDDPTQQPSFDDLSVRFYYRQNAENDSTFELQPIFDSGDNGSSMSYTDFIQTMQDLGKSADEWCDICGPTPAPWCTSTLSDDSNDQKKCSKNAIEPAVAGVLGAVIMLAILALIGGCLYIFGGFSLKRHAASDSKDASSNRDSGGFKGPEKKEGDKDVAVTRTGAHHERVGSWELRNGTALPTTGGPVGAGIVTKDLSRDRSDSIDDDAISIVGETPVKAHETV